ncbi:MAG: hypothetical protein ACT4QC_06895 [Planctomycetaceae bacterium]
MPNNPVAGCVEVLSEELDVELAELEPLVPEPDAEPPVDPPLPDEDPPADFPDPDDELLPDPPDDALPDDEPDDDEPLEPDELLPELELEFVPDGAWYKTDRRSTSICRKIARASCARSTSSWPAEEKRQYMLRLV